MWYSCHLIDHLNPRMASYLLVMYLPLDGQAILNCLLLYLIIIWHWKIIKCLIQIRHVKLNIRLYTIDWQVWKTLHLPKSISMTGVWKTEQHTCTLQWTFSYNRFDMSWRLCFARLCFWLIDSLFGIKTSIYMYIKCIWINNNKNK